MKMNMDMNIKLKSQKKKAWVAMVMVLMLLTAACSSGNQGSDSQQKDKPKTKDGKTIVTVALLGKDRFYEAAKTKFESKHPDIEIQLQPFKQPDDKWNEGDYEKFIKATNTAVLSGKGADILPTNNLAINKFTEKKLLLDMNTLLDKDTTLDKSKLQGNVLKAMEVKGGLYRMPITYFMSALVGDNDILQHASAGPDDSSWDWQKFSDYARKLIAEGTKSGKSYYAWANDKPEDALTDLIVANYPQFINQEERKANFESQKFLDNLSLIQELYEDQVLVRNPDSSKKALFSSTVILSPADFIEGQYSLFSNPKLLQKPHEAGQSSGVFFTVPYQLGIQAKSAVQDEAWQFIAFLLSEEMQAASERYGFSMQSAVNEKELQQLHEQTKKGDYKISTGDTVIVSDEQFAAFKAFLPTAGSYVLGDERLFTIITEEAKSFFNKQKFAAEVAKLIQNRVTTYLNE